jgi:hypothetical protein
MSEEDEILWQDVLDQVAAGRVQDLRCPFCQQGKITLDETPERTRLECRACRRFIEGKLL